MSAAVVFRDFRSDCAAGLCLKGCSHQMWWCRDCQCEGGWGAPVEKLSRLAAEHVCPPAPGGDS